MEIPPQPPFEMPLPQIDVKPKSTPWRFLVLMLTIGVLLLGSALVVGQAPENFVPGTTIHIRSGSSVSDTGDLLEESAVIRSSSVFQFVIKIMLAGRPVIAGEYQFDEPHDVFKIAKTVTGGSFGKGQVRLTFPEGSSIKEIARITARSLDGWSSVDFIATAKGKEGYLFPDTYLVFRTITPAELVERLEKEFDQKIKKFDAQIASSGHSREEIIIMASLLEKEARNSEEARVISGILWKRIKAKRALQVDAPFLYTLGKTSVELTTKDLQKDGPYNTYTRTGLPAGPIGNPGVEMIAAALMPVDSEYWYYLHGSDGAIHYAKTYEGHLANKKKYIK